VNPAEWVILIGAVTVAISAIGLFVLKIYKIAKRIDGALGVDKEGRTISDRLGRVEHQLFPNGGSSLTDKINRIERDQSALQSQIHSLQAMVVTILGGIKNDDRAGRAS
jgi:hypothetical protein